MKKGGRVDFNSDQAAPWTLVINGRPFVYDSATTQAWPVVMGGADDPASDDPGASTGGDGDDPPKPDDTGGDAPDEKQLPQSKVNEIVAREVQKATRGKLDPKELGFESRKDMEEFIEARRKADEESRSEDEKRLQEAIDEAREQAKGEVLSTAQKMLVKAEFKLKAQEAGVTIDLDDALAVAQGLDAWSVEVDEQGNVSGIDDTFFEELKEAKSYMFVSTEGEGGPKKTDIGAGARGGTPNEAREAELRATYPALGGAG